MIRTRFLSFFLLGAKANEFDRPSKKLDNSDPLEKTPSFERAKALWNFSSLSPEREYIKTVGVVSYITGLCTLGLRQSIHRFRNYVKENKHVMFLDPKEARRGAYDQMILGFLRDGSFFGVKLALSSMLFVGLTTSFMVYRNQICVRDHILTGGVLGALYRTLLGPRAMMGSFLIGGALGGLSGLSSLALLTLSGESVAERSQRLSRSSFVYTSIEDNQKALDSWKSSESDFQTESETQRRLRKAFKKIREIIASL